MARLFLLILMAPFWVHFLLAAGVITFGHHQHDLEAIGYAEKLRLAEASPPDMMPITAFTSDAPRTRPVEVNLRAQIAIQHNVQLVKTRKGKTVGERSMYILVAPDAVDGDKTAYGAVVLDPSQVDDFVAWVMQTQLMGEGTGNSQGVMGPVLNFSGLIDWPADQSHIREAIINQGLTPAKKLIFVTPFLNGRAAGLAITKRDEPLNLIYTYYFAGFFVLMGVLRFALRLRKRAKPAAASAPLASVAAAPATAPQVETTRSALPPEPVRVVASAKPDIDFIGALARKRQADAEPVMVKPELSPVIVSSPSLGDRVGGANGGMLGRLARKAGGVAVAMILYLLVMNFSSSMGLPSDVSLTGQNAPQVEAPMAVATAPSVPTSPVEVPTAAPLGPIAETGTPAAPQVEPAAIVEPVAASGAQKPKTAVISAAFEFAWAKVKAQLLVWQAAPPLWLIAAILAVLIFVPALILLRGMISSGTRRLDQKMDPFERLLQRRLADQARMNGTVMGG